MDFKIGEFTIQENSAVFIIAEAGVNHNGQLDLALKLIDIAAESGADAVKFQTFKADQVVTEQGEMADYQKKNLGVAKPQRDMLKELELKEEYYPTLIRRCMEKGIIFMSTPHGGVESVKFLETLNLPAYKIGSGDLTNYLLLEEVAGTNKPIFLSSGMATMKEVKDAINFIESKGNRQIAVLQCTTNYPCPPQDVNLLAMKTMMEELDIPVGYSDHTTGEQTAIMAATMGMAIYECHFTLDKKLPGPDHSASSDPKELKKKIEDIRRVITILGNPSKLPSSSEQSMRVMLRKSLVASDDIPREKVLTKEDLEAKRPGNGVSPSEYQFFIGKRAKKGFKKDEQIRKDGIM